MNEVNVLLAEIKEGNRDSFDALKSLYAPLLIKLISSFTFTGAGGREDLSDVAENALLNAALTYDADKGIAFGYYAKVCIRNSLTSAYRTAMSEQKRRNKVPKVKPKRKMVNIPALTGLTEDEIREKINSVLSSYEKEIFDMYLEGIKPAEIGKAIGKDAKSVSNAIYRIRTKIFNLK